MSGDIKMDDPSTVMRKDEEDEHDFEPNRVHREEIYRSKAETGDCPGTFATFVMVGFRCRTMYLATVAREILIPSFRSSLWIRGAPKARSSDSWSGSDREFPSRHRVVQSGHDESSKSRTDGILDGARRLPFLV
jgi:hypothetical protein